MVERLETIFKGMIKEQLSVISINVVFNCSIFSLDLIKGCCVEGKQKST